jgi:hypothetical protein
MMFIIKLKIAQLFRYIWEGITNWIETNVFAPIRKVVKKVVHSKQFIGILMLTIGVTWSWNITFAQYEGADILRFARAEAANFINPGPMVWVNPASAKVVKEKKEELVVVNDTKWQVGEFTAYTPRVEETDGDPYTNAANKRVKEGDIACPIKYAFGTKIEVKGLGVFECWDRMNQRYADKENFDIFMWDLNQANTFGRQKNLEYRVIEK